MRQVDVGQYLNAGTPIVTLTDLDTLHVNFTLPEQARAALAIGQPVEFRVDAFQNRIFKAVLTTIEPQIDPATRNIKIQATLDNPGHLLLPGMFAAARVQLPAQPNILTVPETAVDYSASMASPSMSCVKPTSKDQGRQAEIQSHTDLRQNRDPARRQDRHPGRGEGRRAGGECGPGQAAERRRGGCDRRRRFMETLYHTQ